ncbi:MAG: iron transporter [Flavobacteriaceae bacterium]|nr:iron transporter [Flavobacteriaceae bacterium]|tara:strand:- start:172264 stop:173487 length:1224 start_codon:yes stop_codon:yes gene_type:complete
MKKSILQSLGPGLLFAGAAIGVSHLVQSTKAGAEFGFGLIWALVLAHLCKYPFFQFGPRYSAATGETLLEGYRKLGKGVLVAYFLINFATMFTIQAAVTIVTASLAVEVFGLTNDLSTWSLVLLSISIIILIIGRYKLLDNLMKYIIITLTISTVIAVFVAFNKSTEGFDVQQIIPSGTIEITFLIAFLGWMPAPLDVSIWHSIWSIEKDKTTLFKTNVDDALFDFNIGYLGTLFVGICFVLLGALVMYGSGEIFSDKGVVFANQLIRLYTENLGSFSTIFIAVAAFTTMFSTTITSLDASPRAMAISSRLLFNKTWKRGYWFWILFLGIGTYIILNYLSESMGVMVKVATVISFLTTPFFAILNYKLITSKHVPEEFRPDTTLRIASLVSIVILIGFSGWFLFSML